VPHPAQERTVPLGKVRKQPAGVRTGIVDRAEIAFEKNAAPFIAPQYAPFVGCLESVVTHQYVHFDAKVAGQTLCIAAPDLRRSHAAAIGASCAINGLFDCFGNRLEAAFDKMMVLQPLAKSLVFLALLLAEALDLHEIIDHSSYYRK